MPIEQMQTDQFDPFLIQNDQSRQIEYNRIPIQNQQYRQIEYDRLPKYNTQLVQGSNQAIQTGQPLPIQNDQPRQIEYNTHVAQANQNQTSNQLVEYMETEVGLPPITYIPPVCSPL